MSPKPWTVLTRFSWNRASFASKLSILLVGATTIPVILVTHGILQVAESQLMLRLQDRLSQDLMLLENNVKDIEKTNLAKTIVLQKGIQLSKINLSDTDSLEVNQDYLQALLTPTPSDEHQVSFYVLTDRQGRVVAQRSNRLHSPSTLPHLSDEGLNSSYHASWQLRTDDEESRLTWSSQLPIIQEVIYAEQPRSGAVLFKPEHLTALNLLEQAKVGIHPQKIAGLAPHQQPSPVGAYEIYEGQIGLVILAVQPIHLEGVLVGTVLVGTLLNQNYEIVDRVKKQSGVSTATIFAQDWRISTNVPLPDGQHRAIGTRVSREVAQQVLEAGQFFQGKTNIVGTSYQTAYQPIYSYQVQSILFDSTRTKPSTSQKPIGILYVGNPETQVQKVLTMLALRGYGIGVGILILVAACASPIARSLIASDRQMRDQTHQLQVTLDQLQQTQAQLVQTEKMSGLGQLVAGIAHEINNPVTFIHGNLTYLNEYSGQLLQFIRVYQQEYPEMTDAIVSIQDEVDFEFIQSDLPKLLSSLRMGTSRIQEIVLSLRNFSRMDEAQVKLVDLHEGIESTLIILAHRFKSSDRTPAITLSKNYGDLPPVECYAGQLNQVLMNILANAIDALQEYYHPDNSQRFHHHQTSSPHIDIQTLQLDEDWVAIHVRDNGPGIPEETQQKLFDPFFTTKPVGKGTGLGLSISYQIIVDRHQGELICRSTPGEGTEFILKIPICVTQRVEKRVMAIV